MPRLKIRDDEFNVKELDVAYEPPKFKRYTGDMPPNNTVLIHRITKMWWTQTNDGTSAISILAIAEQNNGDKKKYNGLPTREWLTFKPDAAFRYHPFLNNFGLTLRDIKGKMIVEDEPDNNGDVITSIAGWVVGSDDALCRIVTVQDHYDGGVSSKVQVEGWMPLEDQDDDDEDDDEDDDDEDEEPPGRPTRAATSRGRSRTTQAPARGAKAASGRGASARRKGDPDEDEDEDDEYDDDVEDADDIDDEADEADDEVDDEDEDEPEEAPARSRRAPARTTRAAGRATTTRRGTATASRSDGRSTRSGTRTTSTKRRGGKDTGEDPPF